MVLESSKKTLNNNGKEVHFLIKLQHGNKVGGWNCQTLLKWTPYHNMFKDFVSILSMPGNDLKIRELFSTDTFNKTIFGVSFIILKDSECLKDFECLQDQKMA